MFLKVLSYQKQTQIKNLQVYVALIPILRTGLETRCRCVSDKLKNILGLPHVIYSL